MQTSWSYWKVDSYLNIWAIHLVVSVAMWAPSRAAWLRSRRPNSADMLCDSMAARVTASVGNSGGSTLSQLGSVFNTKSSKTFKISSIDVSSGSKKPALIFRASGFFSSSCASWALTPASKRPTTSETWNSKPPKGRRSCYKRQSKHR